MFEIQFSSLREFLQMGEYGFNVWSVYTLFALFFAINLYFPLLRRKQILREQKRRQFLQTQAPRESADSADSADSTESTATTGNGGTVSGLPGDTP